MRELFFFSFKSAKHWITEVGKAENNLLNICYAIGTKIKPYLLWVKVSANCTDINDIILVFSSFSTNQLMFTKKQHLKATSFSVEKPHSGGLNGMPSIPATLWMKTGDPFI